MTDLSNEDKMKEILQAGAPELLCVKEWLDETQIDIGWVIKFLASVRNIQRLYRWGTVSCVVQDGQIKLIKQEQTCKI